MNRLVYQQDLAVSANAPEFANYLCAPTSLLNLANTRELLVNPKEYVDSLPLEESRDVITGSTGWSRPGLSVHMRQFVNLPVISWQLNGLRGFSTETALRMERAGYIGGSERDKAILAHIATKRIVEIATENPVVVTVSPGFAVNKRNHAIIIQNPHKTSIEVIDPDKRTGGPIVRKMPIDYVLASLAPNGAGTIMPNEYPQ